MYRTVALKAIREGIDTMNRDAVANMVRDITWKSYFKTGSKGCTWTAKMLPRISGAWK